MTRSFWILLSLGALTNATVAQVASPGSGSAAAPAATSRSCPVVRAVPTPGDKQLAAEDYKAAEASYREALASDPKSEDAHLGLVRAFIGEDRIAEAQAEAATMLQEQPHSAVAEVAASEASYRAADLEAALTHAQAALRDDLCDARGFAAAAAIFHVSGLHGTEARYLKQAHVLRPTDELILRAWIQSLPRKERQEELARYLEGPHALSADDTRGYNNELTHLKARRPDECRVTSKAASTTLPLQPIYGDHSYPVAFGLDVRFNDTKRRMQIDTGASGIMLTSSAARALKLEPEFDLKTGGVGDEGQLQSYLAHVHSIQIGDVELTDCMVEVVNKSKLDVDGLIGMDVFSRWLVTLNYADTQLALAPLPSRPAPPSAKAEETKESLDDTGDEALPKDRYIAPDMKDWGRVVRIGHNIMLPSTYFKKQGASTHFLIMDTGASLTSLSSGMAKESGKLHGSSMDFYGLSGKVKKVFETDQTTLRVANLVLPPATYYAFDMTTLSHDTGFEVSGLLGLPTLQRLTIQIDYRDNLVKLNYDPKHDVVRFNAGSN